MNKLLLIGVTVAALAFGASMVGAAPSVSLNGFYVPSTDVVAYEVDGNRGGRDLAVRHECDNGYSRVSRVYWDGPKNAAVNFPMAGTGAWTECTGVVIDLVDLFDPSTWVEVSNTVVVTP